MDHERVKAFSEKLDSISIADYHGLNSPGLTCYLNSVLQVLFMTAHFRETIKRCDRDDSAAIDARLGQLFAALEKDTASADDVIRHLGITDVYAQRDAAEYFEKILSLTSSEASKIFQGELTHISTCLECKGRSDSRNCFWILPLVVADRRHRTYSVEKGLREFFKTETVCGSNRMYCSHCGEKRDAQFECEITDHPEVLTILLKRFSFDHKCGCHVKLKCEVDVPLTLLVGKHTYDLYALVHHFGDLTGGHYTAQIKSFENGAWYHFNDGNVDIVKPYISNFKRKSLESTTAYLLMYSKVNKRPDRSNKGLRHDPNPHSEVKTRGGARRALETVNCAFQKIVAPGLIRGRQLSSGHRRQTEAEVLLVNVRVRGAGGGPGEESPHPSYQRSPPGAESREGRGGDGTQVSHIL